MRTRRVRPRGPRLTTLEDPCLGHRPRPTLPQVPLQSAPNPGWLFYPSVASVYVTPWPSFETLFSIASTPPFGTR